MSSHSSRNESQADETCCKIAYFNLFWKLWHQSDSNTRQRPKYNNQHLNKLLPQLQSEEMKHEADFNTSKCSLISWSKTINRKSPIFILHSITLQLNFYSAFGHTPSDGKQRQFTAFTLLQKDKNTIAPVLLWSSQRALYLLIPFLHLQIKLLVSKQCV